VGAGILSLLFEDPDGIRLELNHVPGKGLWAERRYKFERLALRQGSFRFAENAQGSKARCVTARLTALAAADRLRHDRGNGN
jgi:hypothetical protein